MLPRLFAYDAGKVVYMPVGAGTFCVWASWFTPSDKKSAALQPKSSNQFGIR